MNLKNVAVAGVLFVSSVVFAQQSVVFKSEKTWTAPRWYLVGEYQQNRILWLGGGESRFISDQKRCFNKTKAELLEGTLAQGSEEILVSGAWIAVEVDPEKKNNTIELKLSSGCKLRTTLSWDVAPSKSNLTSASPLMPVLFLKTNQNIYFGKSFDVKAPIAGESSEVSLDVIAGAWKLSFGNSEAAAKQSMFAAPIVESRGEWTPKSLNGLGFELSLLQSIASFGGVSGQDVLLSEWQTGTYYQHVFKVAQGFVLRGHLNFLQRLIDQGEVASIGDYEADHRNMLLGVSAALYFSRYWQLQVRGDYGFAGSFGGSGSSQSLIKVKSHVGYKITDSVAWLVEGSYRAYGYKGYESTKAITVSSGFRLEL